MRTPADVFNISYRGATAVDSQPTPTTSTSSNNDPLLAIMPEFVYSMPAQVIVDGITLSLVSVLGIQLLFTAQYHFPFSHKNYSLQLAGVLMLMISIAVHMNSVLNRLHHQSREWPYMFAYIGQQIPPQDGTWSIARQAFYLLLRAVSIALVHVSICENSEPLACILMIIVFFSAHSHPILDSSVSVCFGSSIDSLDAWPSCTRCKWDGVHCTGAGN